MQTVFAIIALLFAGQSEARPQTVRIGLFSLLKPEAVHARLATGQGARLDAAGVSRAVIPGDLIRTRLEGDRLRVTLSDSSGRVKLAVEASEARILPAAAATVELILPGKISRAVRGEVLIAPVKQPRLLKIVLTTSRESAIASIVAAELSGNRDRESLKALAIIARTFMFSHEGRHMDEGFDFCDTTHCQFYRGEQDLALQLASPVVANAVAQTEGEYLSYGGKPIEGYYTAACGGLSATPEMAWGGRSASGYPYRRLACNWCRTSPYRRWERAISAMLVFDALSDALGFKVSPASEILLENSEADGFVHSVVIRDGAHQTSMTTDDFRRAIGRKLKWSTVLSPSFTIERRGQRMIFRGRGYGSQVGFCLAGAVAQAKAGRSYREILKFYFPEAEIKNRPSHE